MSSSHGLAAEFRRDPLKALGFVWKRAMEIPTRGFPSMPKYIVDEFDKAHGIDTSAIVQIVATDSPNAKHGTRYETVPESHIRWLIEHSGLDLAETTFIDFGSGKGRPCIVAASYPFKAVIGVEYSPALVAICRANLDVLDLALRVSVYSGDATEFRVPQGPILAFFNNPFLEPVHWRVLENLSHAEGPVVIAHRGPGHDVVAKFGCAEIARTEHAARLYRLP